jgi:hypothetical protein
MATFNSDDPAVAEAAEREAEAQERTKQATTPPNANKKRENWSLL